MGAGGRGRSKFVMSGKSELRIFIGNWYLSYQAMYVGGDYLAAVIADIGSHSTRIGFAGEDYPRFAIPTVSNDFFYCCHFKLRLQLCYFKKIIMLTSCCP